MADWKKVRIDFPTQKLGGFIEPMKTTVSESSKPSSYTVYGVSNSEGITVTGKLASKDISNYIVLTRNCFAYNPYRINVGSIGFTQEDLNGCVSPAYVVFKTKPNLSPEFLFLYLKSEYGNHLINWFGNRGGVRNALRYDDLCNLDIPVIDYNAQLKILKRIKQIQAITSKIDTELEEQKRNIVALRQQILQDAIEGKLTPDWRKKNPALITGENHASKLLEKIKSEKSRLIHTGAIPKEKLLASIDDIEKSFVLPVGWTWCRLGEICGFITKGTTPPTHELKADSDIPYLKVYNIVDQKINFFYRPQFVSNAIHGKLSRSKVFPGDILMNIVGPPLGKVAIVPNDFPEWNINQALAIFRPVINEINAFLYTYLLVGFEIKKINTLGVVGQDNISLTQCRNIIFPLPSLAEQVEIMKQVGISMKTIDNLEKQAIERQSQSKMLMQSVLREAFETPVAENKHPCTKEQ